MKLLSHDRTFVGDEFIAQLNVLVFFAAIQYIGVFCDSVISGQLLGEAALAGIMLVNSLIAFGSFISILPVAGSVVLVNVISGLADNDRVEKAYSQGLIMTVVMGGALSIIYVYLRGHLTMFISGSGEPLFYANQYFHFISVLPIFQAISAFLYAHIINQGENHLCAIGAVVQMVSNIILSYILCNIYGIMGVAIGTIVSMLIFIIILAKYFFKEHRILRFQWYFQWKSVFKIMKYSLCDAMVYLNLAIMEYFLTNFMANNFGTDAISILAIVVSLLGFFLAVLSGPGVSAEAFLLIYRTENNQHGILKTMRLAIKAAIAIGVFLTVLVFIFAPQLVAFFGISQSYLAPMAIYAVRVISLIPTFAALIVLYCSYLNYSNMLLLSGTFMFVTLDVILLPASLLGGIGWGLKGIWNGFALSFLLSLAIGAGIVYLCTSRFKFPIVLDEKEFNKEISYDLPFSTQGIGQALDLLERDLKARKIDDRALYKTLLLFEETEALALKRTDSADAIMEINVKIETDKIILILRDSGIYSDVTDVDGRISSFECYAAYQLIGATTHKKFFLTSGYNRTIYHIPRNTQPA